MLILMFSVMKKRACLKKYSIMFKITVAYVYHLFYLDNIWQEIFQKWYSLWTQPKLFYQILFYQLWMFLQISSRLKNTFGKSSIFFYILYIPTDWWFELAFWQVASYVHSLAYFTSSTLVCMKTRTVKVLEICYI